MKRLPISAAAIIASFQISTVLAQEDTAVLIAMHSAPAPIKLAGLPPAGAQGESLRFDVGPVSGFAASAASLSPGPDNSRLGIEQMFLELAGPENGALDGLRVFAERAGLNGSASSALSALAENLTVGSRQGSLLREKTGSPADGGALVSAERASVRLLPKRHEGRDRPLGDQADRGDAIHLRAEIWNLRFAGAFIGFLFPELSDFPELTEIVSGDAGITLDADASVTRLRAAIGLNLDGRKLLRFSARLDLSVAGQDMHALEGFVVMEGAGSGDGSADSAASAWARRLAEVFAERAQLRNSSSPVAQAILESALEFAATGARSTSEFAGTIPAVLFDAKAGQRFGALFSLAASIGGNA